MTDDPLVAFLLARIADDEAVARRAGKTHWVRTEASATWDSDGPLAVDLVDDPIFYSVGVVGFGGCPNEEEAAHIVRWHPARVLAECEAKRQVVADFQSFSEPVGELGEMLGCDQATTDAIAYGLGKAVRALAAVYSDHPDYQQEWKP